MTSLRPTPEQERWRVAAARLGVDRDTPWLAERIGGWRSVALLTRCALFVLGAIAAALTVAITSFLHVPGPLFVAGLLAVVAAECLVVRGRFFGAGVEEALELVGLLLIVFEVFDANFGAHAARLALLVGCAFLVAGLRFLNPLIVALAVAALVAAVDLAAAAAPQGMSSGATAGVLCYLAAALALALGALQFRRPSYDRMLDWLVVAMPLAGYLWLEGRHPSGLTRDALRHPSLHLLLPLLLPLVVGTASLIVGIGRRRHAPILAAMVCVACIAYELRDLSGLPVEIRLMLWGGVALGLAVAVDRALRTPRRGITSMSVGRDKDPSALLQLAGAGNLTPAAPASTTPAAAAPFKGGGGGFDGGGASGGY